MPDPSQPRQQFSEEAIDRLAKSIREKGQLSPIRVRWSDEHGKWVIVAGERRWRATMRAQLPTIECHFHEGELAPSEILEQQLIENCLRQNLQPIEEARAFEKLMNLNGWRQKELATALRLSETRVTRVLSLLKLAPDVQDQINSGKISVRAAYEMSRLPDPDAQRDLANRAAKGKLTCEQTASAVRQRRGKTKPRPRAARLTFAAENGWKVVVSANRKGCYEEIEHALSVAIEEVRHRIRNNVQLF
jgi:ParB family chromosome partitioning protein